MEESPRGARERRHKIERADRCRRMRRYARHFADIRMHGGNLVARSDFTVRRGSALTLCRTPPLDADFNRDEGVVRRCKLKDHVLVQLVLDGRLFGQVDGRNLCVRRGDILLMDMRCQARLSLRECVVLQALVPRAHLCHDLRAVVLPECRIPTRMLASQISRSFDQLAGKSSDAIVDALLAVMHLCLDFSGGCTGADAHESLRLRILAHIDAHLDDPELSAASLQREFGLSRTHLYRLFTDTSGVQRRIRDKRLDAAFADLCRHPDWRIIDVAMARGFSTERQFQRAFLARFGSTPKEVRDRRKGGEMLQSENRASA